MPPDHVSIRSLPCKTASARMAAAGSTLKFIVAVLKRPLGSLTRTRNTLVPASGEKGVPLQLPLAARLNQVGPLSLVKVMPSPFGSLAKPAMETEYGRPAVAFGAVNGLLTNVGARLVAARKWTVTRFELKA